MEDFVQKNPQEIKQELDAISELMAEELYHFRRLEEFKKITFSQITLTKKLEKNCSVTEAEKWAMADDNYKTLVEGLIVAEKKYTLAKSKYANMITFLDCYRSWLSFQKEMIK